MLRRVRWLWGQPLFLSAKRLEDGEWLLIASDSDSPQALREYAERWTIETLFAALKTHGFHLEETHLTQPKRLESLLGLLTLASIWALHAGLWAHAQQPIREKTLQRRQFSVFRDGLDLLQRLVALREQFGPHLRCMPGCLLTGQPLELPPLLPVTCA